MKIKIQNVSKEFSNKKKRLLVLENINLTIREGEFFCILGKSGCGKSTLLNLLGGFDIPTKGKVLIDDREVLEPQKKYFTVFQDYGLLLFHLFLSFGFLSVCIYSLVPLKDARA